MSGLKTYGAIAIMFGCFAIIYPRFMHPFVSNIFGSGTGHKSQDSHPMHPPGHKGHPSERGASGASPEDVRRHMRHGPHPGMRAAAEMQRQQTQQGSGRGMMGVVLPMYAVGIVLYLGYTLYKVFNKTNSKTKGAGRYSWDKTSRYGRDKDRMGFPKDCDGRNDEIRNFLHDQEHRQNLEELLTRVDDKNVSVEEMKVLQQRLEETEAQMTRILQAMRGINTGVDNLAAGKHADGGVPQGNAPSNDNPEDVTGNPESKEDIVKSEGNVAEPAEPGKDKVGDDTEGDESLQIADKDGGDDKQGNEDSNDEIDNDNQEIVDKVMDDMKDEDKDATSEVRQRNVKANEQ